MLLFYERGSTDGTNHYKTGRLTVARFPLGWLTEKPTAHGFLTDLWTARRVADLIRRAFGVEFHPSYLREWMTKRDLSPQKPKKRAQERDLLAVGRWLAEDWPAIQKRGPTSTPTSS